MNEAVKFDDDKIKMELVPPIPLREIAEVFTFGANKYSEWNFMNGKGLRLDRVYGALQRHLNAWYSGELVDSETNKSHLAHAGCCLMMLMEIQREKGLETKREFK